MAQPLRIERDDTGPAGGVVTIWLDDPERPVTVLNRSVIERLDMALDQLGTELNGLVLATSHGRVFVAGADLAEIDGLSDDELDAYLSLGQRVFGRIAALPCCTVAAINGAALGGGLELALHCDVLLGMTPEKPDRPYQVGLPEASLGLCPGWGGTNTLPARIDPSIAIKATAQGGTFPVAEAAELGLIEQLYANREALHAAARERAAAGSSAANEPLNISSPDVTAGVRDVMDAVEKDLPDTDAARAVAECVKAGLSGGWRQALACERERLIALRKTETARERIKAFFDRSR